MPSRNYGLLQEVTLNPQDWRFGAVSGAERRILRSDGQYLDFLPEVEYQAGTFFDTMACVSFSALNCLEIIQRVKGRHDNFSDRFTAKASGTTEAGNYMVSVAESIRTNGVVDEEDYLFPRDQRTPPFLWADYYKELSPDLVMAGKRWLSDWEVSWEWVPTSTASLLDALQLGPIQVSVYAWPKPTNGLYTDAGNARRNHLVTLVGYEQDAYWVIFDHYDATTKKLVWDYRFGSGMRYSLTAKIPQSTTPMPTIVIPDDTLVQDVEQSGSFGLHLNKRILMGDEGQLLATWLMRNKGKVEGKTLPLKKSDWDSFSKFDLRGNPI